MSRVEYDLLRHERPELQLPQWITLTPGARLRCIKHTRQTMIAYRTASILSREYIMVPDSFSDLISTVPIS